MLTLIADTSIIKLYDLGSKKNISTELKKLAFSAILCICLLLQIILLRYTRKVIKGQTKDVMNSHSLYKVAQICYILAIALISLLLFQVFYSNYYNSLILMLIILTTYLGASFFIGRTSLLFFSWYKRNHDFVILMYFISLSLITFNLSLTILVVDAYLIDRPENIREFIGGSMDLSGGKYSTIAFLHKISSVLSFLSIWMTTVVLSYSSRDEIVKKLRYLIMPSLLLIYFLFSYFSQDILAPILIPLLQSDPIFLSTTLLMIFTLSKPVGGIMFGIAFWNISKTVDYEKTLEKYMIITGYGFLFLFSANQSTSLVLTPYPPFGIGTITILIIGSYLIMIGIYTSAALVSKSNDLRKSIHKVAKESKLIGIIGAAEMEKEVNKTVNKILEEVETSEEFVHANLELDKPELKNYLTEVIEQLKKERRVNS